jgi:hypothetical protein
MGGERMSFQYIQSYYKVPAESGRVISHNGKKGIIVEAIGQYIGVVFDGKKASHVLPVHPTDGVEYLGMAKVPKMTASERRYKDYLQADSSLTFAEWLGIKKKGGNHE